MAESSLKLVLHKHCKTNLKTRLEGLQSRLQDLDEALASETKSSVGDKYETGRAMVHLEKDKLHQQLGLVQQQLQALSSLDPTSAHQKAGLGALVETDKGYFYLAVALGKVQVENTTYFVLSLNAPLGQIFANKQVGEVVQFRTTQYKILSIS